MAAKYLTGLFLFFVTLPVYPCDEEGPYFDLSVGAVVSGDDMFDGPDGSGNGLARGAFGYQWHEPWGLWMNSYIELQHESDPGSEDRGQEAAYIGIRLWMDR